LTSFFQWLSRMYNEIAKWNPSWVAFFLSIIALVISLLSYRLKVREVKAQRKMAKFSEEEIKEKERRQKEKDFILEKLKEIAQKGDQPLRFIPIEVVSSETLIAVWELQSILRKMENEYPVQTHFSNGTHVIDAVRLKWWRKGGILTNGGGASPHPQDEKGGVYP
jgi:hypothetical protein